MKNEKKSNFLLGDSIPNFQVLGEVVSEIEINEIIPFDFGGKNDFIRFYCTYNGIFFLTV